MRAVLLLLSLSRAASGAGVHAANASPDGPQDRSPSGAADEMTPVMARMDEILVELGQLRDRAEPVEAGLTAMQVRYPERCEDPVFAEARERLRRDLSLSYETLETRMKEFKRLQETLMFKWSDAGLKALKQGETTRLGVPMMKWLAYDRNARPIDGIASQLFKTLLKDEAAFQQALQDSQARKTRRRLMLAGACALLAVLGAAAYKLLRR